MNKFRGWCFTLNNPVINGPLLQQKISIGCDYGVFQREVGTLGTEHYQGYIYFKSARAMPRRLIPLAHWSAARGSAAQNRVYCTKEPRLAGPWEHGTCPMQGERSDLIAAAALLKNGSSISAVADMMPSTFIANAGGLYKYQRTLGQGGHPTLMLRSNYLFFGATRSGKSYHARLCEPSAYIKTPDKWFDYYCGENATIWDDYSAGWAIPLATLLQLLDGYYTRCEVKGGFEHWLSVTNIFTTNVHPSKWYDYKDRVAQRDALAARFTAVYFFDGREIIREVIGFDNLRLFFSTESLTALSNWD